MRRYFVYYKKKCRIYAAFGVSQTPRVIKKRKENYEDEEKSCIWNIIIYMYDNSNHGGYFNSGIVIEPISSLQEQLEEMTEEMKMS